MFSLSWRLWWQAARPHTLPLAAASVLLAAFPAWQQQRFQWPLFAAMLSTALLLQIFANLANDYGDARHGADHARSDRLCGSGRLGRPAMRRALLCCGALCVASGAILLFVSGVAGWQAGWPWWLAGALSLAAAWHYTAGSRPYGYRGGGEAAVWLFFGLLAVCGGGLLYGCTLSWPLWAAANAQGLWCAAVLNINNLRDLDNDRAAGKYTVAVRLGRQRAVAYHAVLLGAAAVCWTAWLFHSLPFAAALMATALLWPVSAGAWLALCRAARQGGRPVFHRLLAGFSRWILLWATGLAGVVWLVS